jgi:hypothetical protein
VLEIGQRVTGERRRVGPQGHDLGRQPVAPVGFRDVRRDLLEEALGVVAETPRRAELARISLGLEIGRTVEPVDEAGDVQVEAEGEQQVVAGDGVGDGDPALAADGERGGDRLRGLGHGFRSPGTEPIPWPGAMPFSSPTNGMPWRSTASRLIRSADVFASATSRT